MPLSLSQETALANAIKASLDSAVQLALSQRNDVFLKDWANSATTFVVWKTKVTQDEIMQNGFDWVQVDNLSVGKARIWEWLFANESRAINPSKPNVRLGIEECWKGTTQMLAVRAVVYGHCKRFATQAERLFVAGTGTDATPGDLGEFQGTLSVNDVSYALNRNP